ncbi:MAG: M20/M25/M40 family metallo-hydrolase [Acidisphaera sp.]|nr:M20/M25/M40 family metallo-hydrolase [Acidisphaera sp.]
MSLRDDLLTDIAAAEAELVSLFQGFVQVPTANPPGDTRAGAAYLARFLEANGLPFRTVAPMPDMPNLLGSFDCGAPGRHLVLNGHIDVFPPGDDARWRHASAWSGAIEDGRLYGRGSADMKCGTIASCAAYRLLYRHRDRLAGRVTLTAVSDEETGGRWGTFYLFEHHGEEMRGDCCLNGEPSSAHTVRYGEKMPLWLVFTIKTRGAHGAYVHLSESATKLGIRLMQRLEELTEIAPETPASVARNLADPAVRAALESGLGAGAADLVGRVTLNIGMAEGGLKTNMIPSECRIEADIRLPVGVTKYRVRDKVNAILQEFPQATVSEQSDPADTAASWCDPEGEMLHLIQDAAEQVTGLRPVPVITLAATDARFWRREKIPAYIYGCSPDRMGTYDESVGIAEFLNVVRVHALAAAAYLGERR